MRKCKFKFLRRDGGLLVFRCYKNHDHDIGFTGFCAVPREAFYEMVTK